jgi:hypothetical protein
MDRLKKPKDFLEKLRLTDSDYQDSGMINHIADLLERYSTEQLILHGVVAMLPTVTYLEKVNRVEVIDQKGRSYVNWKPTNKTELSLQDDGKTLKVFISN